METKLFNDFVKNGLIIAAEETELNEKVNYASDLKCVKDEKMTNTFVKVAVEKPTEVPAGFTNAAEIVSEETSAKTDGEIK